MRIFLPLLSLILLLACTNSRTKIVVGLQPNEASRNIAGLQERMAVGLGTDVEVVVTKSYSELTELLKKKKVDFAVLSPLNFIDAEKIVPLKVLFKKVYGDAESASEFYYSAFLTLKKSKLTRLEELRGKKVAFVDEKSASGFLYPLVMLQGLKMERSDVEASFHGTHVAAVEALLKGEVDAAAVWADTPEFKTGAWTGTEFQGREDLPEFRVLKYSDPIPNDAIVVREALYNEDPKIVLKFMSALIAMSESRDQILKSVFGVDKLATATSRHYDSVRKLKELKH